MNIISYPVEPYSLNTPVWTSQTGVEVVDSDSAYVAIIPLNVIMNIIMPTHAYILCLHELR